MPQTPSGKGACRHVAAGDVADSRNADSPFDAVAYINEPRWHSSRLGLERISQLLDALGRPQDSLRFVHVAGTNGKGSTCAYLASILQAAGLRTGLFTSPYIERFEERIRIDGIDISPEDLTRATLDVREVAERMEDHPTEFELMCAVAMLHFKRSKCDIVVLEVGLGGRFDATNVIEAPETCIICRIGLDHTNVLGESIAEIAAEKAGILKAGCPALMCPQEEDAARTIERVAAKTSAPLFHSDPQQLSVEPLSLCGEGAVSTAGASPGDAMRRFKYRGEAYETRLLASYQPHNATLAIDAARLLAERGWSISQADIARGIQEAKWPGRFEVVRKNPLFVVDGSHNAQGAQALAATIEELLPGVRPYFLIGVLADKDYASILDAVVEMGSGFVTIAPPNPRALDAQSLADEIEAQLGLGGEAANPSKVAASTNGPMRPSPQTGKLPAANVVAAGSISEGVKLACKMAGADGVVIAVGSLYSIGSIKAALQNI